jgi:hypothetical protein
MPAKSTLPHFRRRVEILLNKGKKLKELISKKSENDDRFEQLWEAFVEEGSDLSDLLNSKGHSKDWAKKLAEQYKIYRKLCQTAQKALVVVEKEKEVKKEAEMREFIKETLRARFDKGEKNLEDLLYQGASGESEEGGKEHKKVWLNKLERALDEQEMATNAIQKYMKEAN